MSKTFLHGFTKIMKNIPIEDQVALSGVGLTGHALYSYGTLQKSTIKVEKLYTYTQSSNTQFMIIDENDKHYNVNNSFWYWKWDSIEDWHTLRENDSINIQYYGYRIPFLGFFPNIVCSKNSSIKDVPESNNNVELSKTDKMYTLF